MREDFLYYIWAFRKYHSSGLKCASGERVVVLNPGQRNYSSGPDFFNAKIQIGEQLWAGNVEMHLRSSDWYWHQHEKDPNYDAVILHVVWEHDAEVFRSDNSIIPTLNLKGLVSEEVLRNYQDLLETPHLRINCENDFPGFSEFDLNHWMERLFFERLESKSSAIFQLLNSSEANWEAVLFQMLLKNFGLNVNGESFASIGQNISFKIIQKLASEKGNLEAFLLGLSGLIKGEDSYALDLRKRFDYLKHKFRLEEVVVIPPKFFRLRPDNFPTIRLAQLAALYSERPQLFSELNEAKNSEAIRRIFKIEVSEYWQSHYTFGTKHPPRKKGLSKDFIDLLIINTIVPLRFAWSRYYGTDQHEDIIQLIAALSSEKNSAITIFEELKPGISKTAFDSQALLQLKKNYCDKNRCLQCELGSKLLNRSKEYH